MTTTRAASHRKHTFLTFYIPWSNLSGAYVPEIYENYTQEYIDLSKKKHIELAKQFGSDYQFIDNLRYCNSLFQRYDIPMLGHNDIFNIKFMLLEEYFDRYDSITYIDFDIIHKGKPAVTNVQSFLEPECAIHWTEPLPQHGVHKKVTELCRIFNVVPNREIWQNNNGVITISKQAWKDLDYLRAVKEIYKTVDSTLAVKLCDESLFNFITMYRGINVTRYDSEYNTLVRRREEFDCHFEEGNKFRMFHFTKHTGKEVLNEELRNPTSILY